jgi:hypothetical protein
LAGTLGRLTQLVEELPWITSLEGQAVVHPGETPAASPSSLLAGLRVAFSAAAFRQP